MLLEVSVDTSAKGKWRFRIVWKHISVSTNKFAVSDFFMWTQKYSFFRVSYQNKIRCFARISDLLWITHLPEDSLRASGNLALTGILLCVPKWQEVTGRGWKNYGRKTLMVLSLNCTYLCLWRNSLSRARASSF
jgi:hypothetical protein